RSTYTVLLLCDRRVSGYRRKSFFRCPGRGAGGLQGFGLALERTAGFLPDQRGLAHQIRANRRAVPTRRNDRRPFATGGATNFATSQRRALGRQLVFCRG